MTDHRGDDKPDFWEHNGDRIVGALAVGILAIGTVVYHLIENWSWIDAFYFSSIAVTSVGFGDFTPSSDASKLFTVFYIFSGLTLIGTWLSIRLKRRAKIVERKTRSEPVAESLGDVADSGTETPDSD